MSSRNKVLTIVVAAVLAVAFVFYVVSNALPSCTVSSESTEVTFGLWRRCASYLGEQRCVTLDCTNRAGGSTCSNLLASRAFMTLACIVSAIAVLCFILSIFITDGMRSTVLMISKGLAFVCLVMGIIGVAIGITVNTDGLLGKGVGLGAGSIIGIIALVINLVGAIGSIIIK